VGPVITERKVVVLGANSFSGQDFVDLLLGDARNRVVGVSRSPERSAAFLRYKERGDLSRYRYVQLDLNREMPKILDLLEGERPEWIVNFAAQSEVAPSWDRPEDWFETNTVALSCLVNHLRKRDYVRRYLHVSSPEVYGTCEGTVREDAPLNPSTPYAASKASADLLLGTFRKQFGFPLLTVRATNVYGSRQQLFKLVPRTVISLKTGRPVDLHGGGTAVKSYIHVRDVSRGELAILEKGTVGNVYHLSPDRGFEVREVVRMICRRMGKSFEESTRIVAERPGQDRAYVIDSTKARLDLGWSPRTGLEEGLAEVATWVDANWPEISKEPLEYVHKR
jgi:dTDP-glucose 4,6-dehydratase